MIRLGKRGREGNGRGLHGLASFPWASILLFALGFTLLLSTTFIRSRQMRDEALSELLREVRSEAAEMEGLLFRLERELMSFAKLSGSGGISGAGGLAEDMAERLLDLGSRLGGVALLDEDKRVVQAFPPALNRDLAIMGFLSDSVGKDRPDGVSLRTGGTFQDGRAVASLSYPVKGDGVGRVAILLVLDGLTPLNPSPFGFDGDPSFTLLDSVGQILVHPVRQWIGSLYLAEEDSLYDPDLHAVLPDILGDEAGAWSLVSEVLATGSWGSGRRSLLAFAPVTIPGGGLWHLGISLTPEEGIFPGLPSDVTVSFSAVLLSLLLMGLALVFPRRRGLRRQLDWVAGERDWLWALVNAEADGLLVLSTDQRVVAANEVFCRLIGWPVDALVGTPYEDLLDRPESLMGPGGQVRVPEGREEVRLRSMNGPPLEVELNTAFFTHGGEDFTLSTIRDATWRQRLERETLRVGERERLLLGKELHDGLGQHLTGVAFIAKTLAKKLVAAGHEGAREAEEIGHLVKDAVGQIRILSKGLELSEYDGSDLPRALEEMAGVVRRLMGVELDLAMDPAVEKGEASLDRTQATQLYRLCHDVVSEAVRARLARTIHIQLRKEGERVVLEIRHDGAKPSEGSSSQEKLPAYRLRYRARLLDASLQLFEDPAGGSVTTCSFQVQGDEA